ncbi:MAG: protein TolR [Dongiaceae bacterium]
MALGAFKKHGKRRYSPMVEINVTPLVDVMLVLLVVFMVAAPLMTVGVSVDLPQANAPALNERTEPLVVSIDNSGKIFLQDTSMSAAELVKKLQAITRHKDDSRIYVRGDKRVNYGRIMEVMTILNNAGFTKVALVAELPGTTNR